MIVSEEHNGNPAKLVPTWQMNGVLRTDWLQSPLSSAHELCMDTSHWRRAEELCPAQLGSFPQCSIPWLPLALGSIHPDTLQPPALPPNTFHIANELVRGWAGLGWDQPQPIALLAERANQQFLCFFYAMAPQGIPSHRASIFLYMHAGGKPRNTRAAKLPHTHSRVMYFFVHHYAGTCETLLFTVLYAIM